MPHFPELFRLVARVGCYVARLSHRRSMVTPAKIRWRQPCLASESVYLITATIHPRTATFFWITALFSKQVLPETAPFAVGNGQNGAAFHPHIVLSAFRGDDFRHLLEVDDNVVVDSKEITLGQRFLEIAQRFGTGKSCLVNEMRVANRTVADNVGNVGNVGRQDLLGRFSRPEYQYVGILLHKRRSPFRLIAY